MFDPLPSSQRCGRLGAGSAQHQARSKTGTLLDVLAQSHDPRMLFQVAQCGQGKAVQIGKVDGRAGVVTGQEVTFHALPAPFFNLRK